MSLACSPVAVSLCGRGSSSFMRDGGKIPPCLLSLLILRKLKKERALKDHNMGLNEQCLYYYYTFVTFNTLTEKANH